MKTVQCEKCKKQVKLTKSNWLVVRNEIKPSKTNKFAIDVTIKYKVFCTGCGNVSTHIVSRSLSKHGHEHLPQDLLVGKVMISEGLV